ncbi:9092_t:CDS:1 [Scutellospora calospora]|uniref:9092_t:CDS:1 n=1 Tax=Scutellospora calospora TaxID=85575 RepID=A0ACA9L8U8_9GLOM|nr:9092_t:CDS:1 [Scutellospora calospora]
MEKPLINERVLSFALNSAIEFYEQDGIGLDVLIVAAFNVYVYDATLVVLPTKTGRLTFRKNYTNYVLKALKKFGKPHKIIFLDENDEVNVDQCLGWINDSGIKELNITGPREEDSPGIYKKSLELFELFYERLYESGHQIKTINTSKLLKLNKPTKNSRKKNKKNRYKL